MRRTLRSRREAVAVDEEDDDKKNAVLMSNATLRRFVLGFVLVFLLFPLFFVGSSESHTAGSEHLHTRVGVEVHEPPHHDHHHDHDQQHPQSTSTTGPPTTATEGGSQAQDDARHDREEGGQGEVDADLLQPNPKRDKRANKPQHARAPVASQQPPTTRHDPPNPAPASQSARQAGSDAERDGEGDGQGGREGAWPPMRGAVKGGAAAGGRAHSALEPLVQPNTAPEQPSTNPQPTITTTTTSSSSSATGASGSGSSQEPGEDSVVGKLAFRAKELLVQRGGAVGKGVEVQEGEKEEDGKEGQGGDGSWESVAQSVAVGVRLYAGAQDGDVKETVEQFSASPLAQALPLLAFLDHHTTALPDDSVVDIADTVARMARHVAPNAPTTGLLDLAALSQLLSLFPHATHLVLMDPDTHLVVHNLQRVLANAHPVLYTGRGFEVAGCAGFGEEGGSDGHQGTARKLLFASGAGAIVMSAFAAAAAVHGVPRCAQVVNECVSDMAVAVCLQQELGEEAGQQDGVFQGLFNHHPSLRHFHTDPPGAVFAKQPDLRASPLFPFSFGHVIAEDRALLARFEDTHAPSALTYANLGASEHGRADQLGS